MADLVFRDASHADVPMIVAMYADDELGKSRETLSDPLPSGYWQAFDDLCADPRQRLVVAADGGEVVGTLQLSFIPHLVLMGGERAQIEAVRVRADRRGGGIGEQLFRWAINEARQRGCRLVQLTSNTARADAIRFYERLGFEPSHIGLKLTL